MVWTSNKTPREIGAFMGDDWLASRIVGRCHVIGLGGAGLAPAGPWWSTEGRQGVGLEHGITINHGHDGRSVFERHGVSVSGCAPPLPGREQSDLIDPTRGCPVCEIGHPSGATNRPIGGGRSGPERFPSGSSGCENGHTDRAESGLMVRKARPECCEIGAGGISHSIQVQRGHVTGTTRGRCLVATIMAATVGLNR